MSAACEGQASSVKRGIALVGRRALQVTDEITGLDGEVRWGMVTKAMIELQGKTALLTESGRRLRAEIIEPAGARFEIDSTKPPTDRENSNQGTSMLAVKVERQADVRITVLLRPDDGKIGVAVLKAPLADRGK